MKLKALAVVVLLSVAACTTPAMKEQAAYDQAAAYVDAELGAARAGRQRWADAYLRIYDYAQGVQDPIIKQATMVGSNYLVPYARARDQGTLSQEQFDDAQRTVNTIVQGWIREERQKTRTAQAHQQAAENAALTNALMGLSVMQAGQPQRIAPVNCTSNRFGSTVTTNCQ